jgi:hypothetical protein
LFFLLLKPLTGFGNAHWCGAAAERVTNTNTST